MEGLGLHLGWMILFLALSWLIFGGVFGVLFGYPALLEAVFGAFWILFSRERKQSG